MSIISRITTWATNQLLTSSALNGEFNNVINVLNNLDAGTTPWDNVSTVTLTLNGVLTTNAAGYLIGSVVQTVSATTTTDFSSTSATFVNTNLAATITPKATTHKIRISITGATQNPSNADNLFWTISRGGTNVLGGTAGFGISTVPANATMRVPASVVYLDAPSTTSATTYTVQIRNTGGVALMHGFATNGGETDYILLEEIAA